MKSLRFVWLTILIGSAVLAGDAILAMGEGPPRSVRGEVIAINMVESPAVIVLRSQTAEKEELIVGAVIEPRAKIMRGSHSVALNTITVGEPVVLTYVKTPEGLRAVAVQAR